MKTQFFLLITCCFLLSACGSSSPESVAKIYWQGIIENDPELIETVSSADSNGELQRSIAPDENSTVSFGETTVTDDIAQVETHLTWVDEDKEKAEDFQLSTVLIKEDGDWKIDTARTRQQFFTAVYRSTLDGLSSALAESLASFQVLGEEAAGDMAEEISSAIDDIQKQSNQANDDVQNFLQSLDGDLREAIESINSN